MLLRKPERARKLWFEVPDVSLDAHAGDLGEGILAPTLDIIRASSTKAFTKFVSTCKSVHNPTWLCVVKHSAWHTCGGLTSAGRTRNMVLVRSRASASVLVCHETQEPQVCSCRNMFLILTRELSEVPRDIRPGLHRRPFKPPPPADSLLPCQFKQTYESSLILQAASQGCRTVIASTPPHLQQRPARSAGRPVRTTSCTYYRLATSTSHQHRRSSFTFASSYELISYFSRSTASDHLLTVHDDLHNGSNPCPTIMSPLAYTLHQC